ncbi:hypothetical protein [Cohnella fermenti]|uniref:Uncharacterized protein n=1 Tax=Cohnella fermenti TaxID=2565925 RepID=A0A4S4BJK5_9BACL|nr:hypothetical protein [Cohnella fermenti]THF74831.1 hypothetical protein E6C55_23915 [Cohnella fermenti]
MDIWLFAQHAYDSKIRRLAAVLKPEHLERAVFEWIGTALQDRGFSGIRESLRSLEEQGARIGGGIDAYYWAPSAESAPPDMTASDLLEADGGPVSTGSPIHYLRNNTEGGKRLIISKLKRQIDLGVRSIHIDEYDHGTAESIDDVIARLRAYAMEKHDRPILVSTNSRGYGGQDFTMYCGAQPNGRELADFYVRSYPLRLQGLPAGHDFTGAETEPFDGTYHLIPEMREAHRAVAPKRFYYFIDFAGSRFVAPKDFSVWPNYVRIAEAQIMAAGGIPGAFRSFYNRLGAYERGLHAIVANRVKFIRELGPLLRDLEWIEPQHLRADRERIWTSAFRQPDRTIVHAVNGNYDNGSQSMAVQRDVQIELSVDEPVKRIWLTTPDLPSSRRRTVLEEGEYEFRDGRVRFRIPALDFHVIAVLEHGAPWDPVCEPMAIVHPFPLRTQLPVGNEVRLTALPTEGTLQELDWSAMSAGAAEGSQAGRFDVGSVDETGLYRAPTRTEGRTEIVLRAASREEPSAFADIRLAVVPNLSLPWTPAADGEGVPDEWEIVEGRGDWASGCSDEDNKEDAVGRSGLVLRNTNIAEATVELSIGGGAGYATLLSGGDQTWSDCEFRVRWTSERPPIVWYGLDSERPNTYVGFVFRYRNSGNYWLYQCGFDGFVRLYRYRDGVGQEVGQPAAFRYPDVEEPNDIRVTASGADFRFERNGVRVRDDRGVGEADWRCGSIGFGTSFTANRFERIEVRGAGRGTS